MFECVYYIFSSFFYYFVRFFYFFFFSSRRRHTRSLRDWSSDVCSSDLAVAQGSSHGHGCQPGAAQDEVRGLGRHGAGGQRGGAGPLPAVSRFRRDSWNEDHLRALHQPRLSAMVTADDIDALLPQTQCTRCGYGGCRPYAEALLAGEAPINQCPPGGAATIGALAALQQRP